MDTDFILAAENFFRHGFTPPQFCSAPLRITKRGGYTRLRRFTLIFCPAGFIFESPKNVEHDVILGNYVLNKAKEK